MKKIYFSKMLGILALSTISAAVCQAGSSSSYNCDGMDTNGKKMHVKLALTSTDKSDVFKTVWSYGKSNQDIGEAHVTGKDRMFETFARKESGIFSGHSDIYQINDKQMVINYEDFHKINKIRVHGVMVCNLAE